MRQQNAPNQQQQSKGNTNAQWQKELRQLQKKIEELEQRPAKRSRREHDDSDDASVGRQHASRYADSDE